MLKRSQSNPHTFTQEQIDTLNEVLSKLPEGELEYHNGDNLNPDSFIYHIPSISSTIYVEATHPDVKNDPEEKEQLAIYWGGTYQDYAGTESGMYAYWDVEQLKKNKNRLVKLVKKHLPAQLPFIRFFDEKAKKAGITPTSHTYPQAVEAILINQGQQQILAKLKKSKLIP